MYCMVSIELWAVLLRMVSETTEFNKIWQEQEELRTVVLWNSNPTTYQQFEHLKKELWIV